MPAIVDYSQPLATIMKESTIEVHNEVEHSEGAKLLLSGELPKEEYARFLMMLWYIYEYAFLLEMWLATKLCI